MAFELPEAKKVARQMHDALQGKIIVEAVLGEACAGLIKQGFINLHEVNIEKRTVDFVTSKGKWIYVKLMSDMYLLLALETGGKILYHDTPQSVPEKFHVRLFFTDNTYLTIHIIGYGFAKALLETELPFHTYPGKPGLSPIDEGVFTPESFCRILDGYGKKTIKCILLEQKTIAGIGNGYLQDILYEAQIHPKRKAADITEEERRILYEAITRIMQEAVQMGGNASEYDLYNQPGGYRRIMGNHMKGQPCPRCGTAIGKISVLGSTCYICPRCQQ